MFYKLPIYIRPNDLRNKNLNNMKNEIDRKLTNLGVLYGECGVPEVYDTSLTRVSHILKPYNNLEYINIQILGTPHGLKLKDRVNNGIPLFGVIRYNTKPFQFYTIDVVFDPPEGFILCSKYILRKMKIKRLEDD